MAAVPQRLQGRLGMPAETPAQQRSQFGGPGGAAPQQAPLQQRAHWGGSEAGSRQRNAQQRSNQQRPAAMASGSGWDSPETPVPQRAPQGRPAAQAPVQQGWDTPVGPVSQVAQQGRQLAPQGRQVAEAPLPQRLQGRLGGAQVPPHQAPQQETAPAGAPAQHGSSWEQFEPMPQVRGQSTSGSHASGDNEAQVGGLRPEHRSLKLCRGLAAWQGEATSVVSCKSFAPVGSKQAACS